MGSTQQQDAQRLMATGIIGQATVRELRETGLSVDASPLVEFDLLVAVDGWDPYAVTHRQPISRIVLANFQGGTRIPVRVDPSDAHHVLIG